MSSPKPNDHLNIIQPYKGGKRSVPGVEKVYKLSANENPFGASNSAMKVFKESCKDLSFYPDSSNSDLVKALGDYYGLEENGFEKSFETIGQEVSFAIATTTVLISVVNSVARSVIPRESIPP